MKIKQVPEDFVVKELIKLELDDGPYTYFKLKKKNWNTISAVKEIAKRLGIKEKNLNYAGIKDKHAITEQIISAYKISKEKLEALNIKDIGIEVIGNGKTNIHTELLEGNEFEVVVRDLDKVLEKKVEHVANYFDEQRFGINADNHLAGKALLKKDFKEACNILDIEAKDNNYISALRSNKRLLKLIFNSYQSYLFNLALAEYVKLKSKDCFEVQTKFGILVFSNYDEDLELPLIQFDTELDGDIKKIYEEILKKENITRRDFVIKQFPELLSQTVCRKAFVKVKDFTSEVAEDELNKGKKKQTLKFKLPKGSYATIVVKFLYHDL